jgi:hypothetical protein
MALVDVVPFPGQRAGRSEGSGQEDPMLEARVGRLEDDMKDVKSSLKSIEISLAEIKGRLTGIDARFASLPTTWTMLTITFATWGIGSGILIFALNVLRK